MIRMSEPSREPQTVARLIGREGWKGRRRTRLDRFAPLIIVAAVEHIGRLRLRQLPHHHDLLRLLGQVVSGQPCGCNRGTLRCGRLVEGGSEIAADQLAILLRGDDILDRTGLKEVADLQVRETPVEHTEVVHQTILEAVVPHPFANANVVATAARDLPRETVADDLRRHRMPVHEDLQARGLAGAVIRHGHVHPFSNGQRLRRSNRDRIPGPEVDERPLQVAVEHQKFVATTGRIGPSLRSMEHDGPLIATRCLEPGRDSEGLAPPEVAHRRLHRMVAREVHGLAGMPLHERVLRRRCRGLVGGKQAGELTVGAAFVK